MDKVAVVGLGKAGLPLAAVIADSGLKVVGIDLDKRKIDMINSGENPIPEEVGLDELIEKHGGKNIIATNNYDNARDCRAYIVIVPLLIDKYKRPDYHPLKSAFLSIGAILKKGDIVVLETTVPPGTTEGIVRSWLEEKSGLKLGEFYLAHSPERIMTGYSISRLRNFPKVIGGVDEESGKRAYELYRKFIPNIRLVSNSRTAEFIKVIEGCYRDVNIALANELFKIAEEIGVDFYEAREYANHEYCHIHLPSTGVGGHCIGVYPWFLINEMEAKGRYDYVRMLRCARVVNDEMVNYWVDKVILEALNVNKPLKDVKICVKGITFREGVKELYHSRNLELVRRLMEKGLNVFAYDELLSKEEIEDLGLKYIRPEDADVVFDSFNLIIKIREGMSS
ncbi:MAG: nucleotide sugar dehydrogenase [Candidatus Asgardarchaeia archaeon]